MDLSNYSDAIGQIESGGDYGQTGPVTKNGDRAYGKYQVMGANIPAWTQAATGTSMSPQQFLKDPDAQDAVFNHQFGNALKTYGSPDDAASVWFSGRPFSDAVSANANDGYNSVSQYVGKFHAALNRGALTTGQTPMADPGALSSNATPPQPPGALYGQPSTMGTIGDTLQGMGAGLQSIYQPAAASQMMNALTAKRQAQYNQQKPQLVETGQDPFTGQKTFGMFRPSTGQMINFNSNGQVAGGGPGSASPVQQSFQQIEGAKASGASADDLYQFVPAMARNDVKALVEGTQVPQNYARGGQTKNLLQFYASAIGDGQNGRPQFDATKLPGRVALNTALENPKAGNVGGQVNAVRTMFDHIAGQVAPAMVSLNNSEGLGSVDVARATNQVTNRFMDNPAKAAALSDAVDTLTGEKAKYYYGLAGGGVEERQATRMRFNPNDPPSVQAATLETERDLAIAKQGEMQTQIDEAKGQGKYQVMGPQELKSLDTINKQISVLKARAAGVNTPPASGGPAPQQAAPEVRYDSSGKAWTRDAQGSVVPFNQ